MSDLACHPYAKQQMPDLACHPYVKKG